MKKIERTLAAVVALGVVLAVGLIGTPTVAAEEKTVNAFAAYEGEGKVYLTGEKKGTFVGAIIGELFVESEKGPRHAGRITCPAMLQINLELYIELKGEEDEGTLRTLGNLGFLMLQDGRPEEAFDLVDEALAGTRRNLGDGHPETVKLIITAAEVRLKLGQAAESIPYWEEALRLGPGALGEDSSQLKFARRRLDAALLVE